jgi:hypothetical protein
MNARIKICMQIYTNFGRHPTTIVVTYFLVFTKRIRTVPVLVPIVRTRKRMICTVVCSASSAEMIDA